jgi:hypothetical protein
MKWTRQCCQAVFSPLLTAALMPIWARRSRASRHRLHGNGIDPQMRSVALAYSTGMAFPGWQTASVILRPYGAVKLDRSWSGGL